MYNESFILNSRERCSLLFVPKLGFIHYYLSISYIEYIEIFLNSHYLEALLNPYWKDAELSQVKLYPDR